MIVQITVKNKIAFVTAVENVVCNNSDYAVVFSFDDEWAGRETKTARFKWNGKYTDVAFSGDTVMMPVIKDTRMVEIGVYAGDIYTTTAAVLPVLGSILSGEAEQDAPTEDVYNQIIELINSKPHLSESDVQSIIAEYFVAHPETDPTVPAWAKAETKPTYTADEVGAYTKAEVDEAIATAETETDTKLLSYRLISDSYSKSETDTLLASAGKVKTVNGVEPDANGNIEIDGGTGKDGTTFTPSVSSDGTLSWTNDGGKDNPASVNIKGAKGDTGATPNLQIGDVTTLAAGSSATATITGTADNPLLNLGIPKGKDGSGGSGGGGSSDTITVTDTDNSTVYTLTLKLVGGKPVIEYE